MDFDLTTTVFLILQDVFSLVRLCCIAPVLAAKVRRSTIKKYYYLLLLRAPYKQCNLTCEYRNSPLEFKEHEAEFSFSSQITYVKECFLAKPELTVIQVSPHLMY